MFGPPGRTEELEQSPVNRESPIRPPPDQSGFRRPAWGKVEGSPRRASTQEIMASNLQEDRFGEPGNGEPRATEKQRWALYRWGVERERAEDPGLTRTEASKWLGALIAGAKGQEGESREPGPEERESPTRQDGRPAVSSNGERVDPERRSERAATAPEPESLEIEVAAPTGIPYSTIRVRAAASRKPGESLRELADRLTEELAVIVREEGQRIEEELRPRPGVLVRQPDDTNGNGRGAR